MKKNNDKKIVKPESAITGEKINRKEALRKAGYYGISAATLMILMASPKKAAASPSSPPPW